MRAFHPGLPVVQSCDRRGLVRLGALLAAGGFGLRVHGADAGRGWCRSDPLLLIDGILVDIFCTAPLSVLWQATGPTQIDVTVPDGVKATLVLAGIGFGRGERLRFANSKDLERTEDSIEVRVEVLVPARENLPIGVEFAPRILGILNPARAEGFANSIITLTTKLADGGLGILGLKEERAASAPGDQSKQRTGRKGGKRKGRRRRR